MNSILLAMALFFSSFSPIIHAEKEEVSLSKSHQIVGRFVKPNPKLGLPYKHYFIFSNSKGQKMAFPLVNKSSMDMSKIDYDQIYHINVRQTQKTARVGEEKKSVKVLEMVEGKVFNMKDLGLAANKLPMEPTPNIPNQQSPHHPMFRINDNVANTAIFTAGAILLGSMLLAK